jgi:hypothetical protein
MPKHRLKAKRQDQRLRRLERVLGVGNWLYKAVCLIERNWRTEVLEGKTPYDPADAKTIGEFYSRWVQPCKRCLDEISIFESRGCTVHGAKEFKGHCTEATDILGGYNAFFEDADKAGRWAALTAKYREAIRPVEVDDSGRIFESTGERFNMPGLEPADILEAIEDERAGRVRSLREIIDSSGQHGI